MSGLTLGEISEILESDPYIKRGEEVQSITLGGVDHNAEWERNRRRPWQE